MNFQPGTVVKIKSGGPLMTIEKAERDRAWCHWYASDKPQVAVLPMAILEEYRERDLAM